MEDELTFFIYGKSYSGKRLQRALLLKLLSEKGPMRAYEVLKELKTMGFKVSPSSVYNLLRQLEEEGSVRREGELYVAVAAPEADEGVKRILKVMDALRKEEFRELLELLLRLAERYDDEVSEALRRCSEELRRLVRP